MKTTLIPAALLLAIACSTPRSPDRAAPRGDTARSLGPIHLGMTRDEVAAVGIEVKPDPSGQFGDAVHWAGPYRIVFDDAGIVSSIETALAAHSPGIRVDNRELPPDVDLAAAAAKLGTCDPVDHAEGGDMIACDSGKTLLKQPSDGSGMLVQIQR